MLTAFPGPCSTTHDYDIPSESFPIRTTQIISKAQGKKVTDSRTAQEIHKMKLNHFVVSESKEVLKKQANKSYLDESMSKGHRSQLKGLPMAKVGIIQAKK